MIRIQRAAGLTGFLLVFMLLAGCQRPVAPQASAAAAADEFRASDPSVIAATGRPQLLEFYTPT